MKVEVSRGCGHAVVVPSSSSGSSSSSEESSCGGVFDGLKGVGSNCNPKSWNFS